LQTNPNFGFYATPTERLNAILDQEITVFYALQVSFSWLLATHRLQLQCQPS
jgi:hypothetical protein